MPNHLNLEPFTFISDSTSIDTALAMFRAHNETFAIIGDEGSLKALVQETHLAQLDNTGDRPLTDVLEHLPALFIVEYEEAGLGDKDIEQFTDILGQTQAPGIVVCRANQVIGVLPASAVFDALNPSDLLIDTGERIHGNFVVPIRTFICRKCPLPQPRRRPRDGSTVPICPRDSSHGLMEREEL